MITSCYMGFAITIYSFRQSKVCEKSLNFSQCNCDCHTPPFIHPIDSIAMGLFQLNLVQCPSIDTTTNNSIT